MVISDPNFYQKLLEVSSEVQMKPEDLLNVMAVESGIDPTAHNQNGNASGLLQFMPSTLKNLGFHGTHADFRNLSSIDQLDYVKKLILNNIKYNGGPFTSAAQYYVANFLPVALKLPGIKKGDPNTIIVAKNPDKPHLPNVSTYMESIYYNANPGLDADHDGMITYGDIQKVLNQAAAGKNYHNALALLHNSTGYQPSTSKVSPSMVAINTKPTSTYENIFSILDHYLRQIAASEKGNKKLYKKYLPKNNMTIKILADNYVEAVEFATILTSALNEELLTDSFIHTDGQQVEVEANICGPQQECFNVIKELTSAVNDAFKIATKKMGKIRIDTQFFINKKSSYKPISLKSCQAQHRKFLLKLI